MTFYKFSVTECGMMKVSTKGRYALRLMLDLAQHDNGELVSIKNIATRQQISEKYLEQIISILKRAGYVKSLRGAQGGYRLAKKPSEYTVGMILRLTEGNLAPVTCLEDEVNECEHADTCVSVRLWTMMNDAVQNVIDKVTLQDMLDWSAEECLDKCQDK